MTLTRYFGCLMRSQVEHLSAVLGQFVFGQLKRPTLGATLDFGFDGSWYEKSFVRGEASFVQPVGYTLGDVFGNQNRNPAQVRGLIESGLLSEPGPARL